MTSQNASYRYTDIAVNLCSSQFKQPEQVINNAQQAGVHRLLNLAGDLNEAKTSINLADAHKNVFSTAGVHPHYADSWTTTSTAELSGMLDHPKVVAVGECGLDYNRDFSPRPMQRLAFAMQLQLAVMKQMPVLLHCREAYQDFVPMLADVRKQLPAAVLHCFTGTAAELEQALSLDCYIGITGWICDERRGQELRQLVSEIPDNRLLLETDAPYLLPRDLKPKPKSRRNEPMYLPHIAATVAELRGQPIETLAQLCEANATRAFSL